MISLTVNGGCIDRIHKFVDLLSDSNFEVGFLNKVPEICYHIYGHKLVIVEQCLGNPLDGFHEEYFDPHIITQYRFIHEQEWNSLNAEAKNRAKIIEWVNELLDHIR